MKDKTTTNGKTAHYFTDYLWICSNCNTQNDPRHSTCEGCGKYRDSNTYNRKPGNEDDNKRYKHKPGGNAEFPSPIIFMNGTTRPW